MAGLKDNRPKSIEDVDKLLRNKNLSQAERISLTNKKKRMITREQKKKREASLSPKLRAKKKREEVTQRLNKAKTEFSNKNHGSTEVIKKLTFSDINNRVNKMLHGSTLSVYAGRIAHWISKGWGESEVPLKQIASNRFLLSTNKIYTRNAVKMPIAIIGFGNDEFLPVGWLDNIRDDLNVLENTYNISQNENLRIALNEVEDADYSPINFSSSKPLQNDYKRAINDITGKTYTDYSLDTYDWLQDLEIENKDSIWETRQFLELVISGGPSGKTAELLRQAYEEVSKRLRVLQMKTQDLYLTVQNYYDAFSPLGHNHKKGQGSELSKKYVPVIRSGQMIVSDGDLQQGSISDIEGVPVGIDVNSGKPIFIDYTNNNLPPSTIVSAVTGAGKTYLMQSILGSLLLWGDKYFPVIVDYKNEYVELGRSAGMQIISSSPADGLYYDTMELAEPTGDPDIDSRQLTNSIETTDNVFEILLGDKWEKLKPAYEYTRRSLYQRQGVYLDKPNTWKNSKGLTFHTFYNEIYKVLSEDRIQAQEETDLNDFVDLRRTLSEYFEIDGSKASYFKQPIRMKDINSSRGVIFALDRKGEVNNSQHDTKLLLTMQFIMHILNNLTDRKSDKRLIPIYWEETNQLLLIPKVANMISSLTTGGRSRGIRNFFITNSPGQIFRAEQESEFATVDPGVISTIMSNAQSIIVGANSQEDMNTIADKYHLNSSTIKVYLKLLAEQASKGNDDQSSLAHKFIIRHQGHTTLMQAVSNDALAQLGVFGTEVDINRVNNSDEKKEQLMKELLNTNKDTKSDSVTLNKERATILQDAKSISGNTLNNKLANSNMKRDNKRNETIKNNQLKQSQKNNNSNNQTKSQPQQNINININQSNQPNQFNQPINSNMNNQVIPPNNQSNNYYNNNNNQNNNGGTSGLGGLN